MNYQIIFVFVILFANITFASFCLLKLESILNEVEKSISTANSSVTFKLKTSLRAEKNCRKAKYVFSKLYDDIEECNFPKFVGHIENAKLQAKKNADEWCDLLAQLKTNKLEMPCFYDVISLTSSLVFKTPKFSKTDLKTNISTFLESHINCEKGLEILMGLRNIKTCNSICTQLVANDFGEVDKIPIDCNERPESVKIIPVNLTIVDDFDDDDYLESENMVHSSDPSFYFPREYLSMQQQIIRVEMYVGEWCRLRDFLIRDAGCRELLDECIKFEGYGYNHYHDCCKLEKQMRCVLKKFHLGCDFKKQLKDIQKEIGLKCLENQNPCKASTFSLLSIFIINLICILNYLQ